MKSLKFIVNCIFLMLFKKWRQSLPDFIRDVGLDVPFLVYLYSALYIARRFSSSDSDAESKVIKSIEAVIH